MRTGFRAGDGERQHAVSFYGDDIILILQSSFHHEELRGTEQQPVFLKQIGIDDGIGYSSLILDAEKNKTFGGAGTLAANDASSNTQMLSIRDAAKVAGFVNAHRIHARPVIGHRVRPDCHTSAAKVCDQAFFLIHGTQRRTSVGFGQSVKQGTGMADGAFDLPECVAAMKLGHNSRLLGALPLIKTWFP